MARRRFVEIAIREQGSTNPVPRYRLTCGSCGVGETLGRLNFGPEIAAEQVPKKFEARGWVVGRRADGADDRCPACVNREAEARRKKLRIVSPEEPAVMSLPKTQPIVSPANPVAADSPRPMSRDERRLIWSKLEDVYLDERRGYTADWDDERVAIDLGVPRAWISQIREENFGPDVSIDLEELLKEASACLAEYYELHETIEEAKARCEEADNSFRRAAADLKTLQPRVNQIKARIEDCAQRLKRTDRQKGAA